MSQHFESFEKFKVDVLLNIRRHIVKREVSSLWWFRIFIHMHHFEFQPGAVSPSGNPRTAASAMLFLECRRQTRYRAESLIKIIISFS